MKSFTCNVPHCPCTQVSLVSFSAICVWHYVCMFAFDIAGMNNFCFLYELVFHRVCVCAFIIARVYYSCHNSFINWIAFLTINLTIASANPVKPEATIILTYLLEAVIAPNLTAHALTFFFFPKFYFGIIFYHFCYFPRHLLRTRNQDRRWMNQIWYFENYWLLSKTFFQIQNLPHACVCAPNAMWEEQNHLVIFSDQHIKTAPLSHPIMEVFHISVYKCNKFFFL